MSDSQKRLIQIRQIQVKKEQQEQLEATVENTVVEEEKTLQAIRNEVEELLIQKDTIIQETKEEVEQEKINWEQEKQQYIELAKQEGYQAGFNLGKDEGLAEYQGLIAQANSIIQSATNDYHTTIEKSEDSIVEMAVFVAEKILKQQITEKPETFLHIVREAIDSLKDKSSISIYLHPNNYEAVLQQKNELKQIVTNKAELSLYVDEKATEGSCVIEHPFGKIDASIDTQLLQIRDVLHVVVMENKQ
ncbi:flagellar assembly protein FliH [Ornithinibacillus caprae]|uniref:flagellar assembly protein FliH n=1 Tax=Ornithinibacillus caprae TaxID=2678566 RepID=UPI0018C4F2FE|nr:flagellar assembly protein FliH [Ornithinibacillus caprae]